MVKCLICGAVFEDGTAVCPVCGAGPEHFVPAADEPQGPFRQDTEERFLILGGGIAGLKAAEAIRERNATAGIVILSDEPVTPYNRPMLTKAFSDAEVDERFAVHSQDWYRQKQIYCLTGKTVARLSPERRLVSLSDGTEFQYDKCIYALGAECFVPPMPGADLPGVFAIRRLADAVAVRAQAQQSKTAVVIGGGVLGLEAAWELKQAGLQVAVVEVADRLMGRQLDLESAAFLRDLIERQGVKTYVAANVSQILGQGKVEAVALSDGTHLAADMVVISCGVRANAGLAKSAGLKTGRGVQVDDHMRTSEATVFACGDCAELDGKGYGVWPEASSMGQVAGANAAGDDCTYTPGFGALSFFGMGTKVYVIGNNGKTTERTETLDLKRDEAAGILRRFTLEDGRLRGAILIGDLHGMAELADAVATGAPRDAVMLD